jgi:hypothetical protein
MYIVNTGWMGLHCSSAFAEARARMGMGMVIFFFGMEMEVREIFVRSYAINSMARSRSRRTMIEDEEG